MQYVLTFAAVPSPPTGPLEIRLVGHNTSTLEWGIPESDGGAPLEGYNIAIRDISKTMWMEVGRVPAGVQKFHLKDLQDDHEYLIRIFARNEIGSSEPLESDEPYKVELSGGKCTLFNTVHSCGFCCAEFEMKLSVLSAEQDFADDPRTEGTAPTGFSTENTSSWMREHNMDADISSYARAKLLRKDEYFFRVWYYAKNLFREDGSGAGGSSSGSGGAGKTDKKRSKK